MRQQEAAPSAVSSLHTMTSPADGFLSHVVETLRDGILIVDQRRRVTLLNAAAERILGIERGQLLGRTLDDTSWRIVEVDGIPAGRRRYGWKALLDGEQWTETRVEIDQSDGVPATLAVHAMPLRDARDDVQCIVMSISDVTAQVAQEREARLDPLTGLPDRNLLWDRAQQAISESHRDGRPVSLLLMDVTQLREINSAFGHHYGDQLLRQLADRLREVFGHTETIARLGGDEFGVLLAGMPQATATLLAHRFLEAVEQGFTVEGTAIHLSLRIGLAGYPGHARDAATLVRSADIAMYVAKRDGVGLAVYTTERDESSTERVMLTGELRGAIDNEQLILHYQPKVHLRTSSAQHVEALLRWNHPRRGIIPPDSFVFLAEGNGLIRRLTLWTFNEALRQVRAWCDGGDRIGVAVNLSASMLQDEEIVMRIAEMLQRWNVEPELLRVEITETAIMADSARARDVLNALQSMGIELSIDDFGTGYSSLAYLQKLPVSEIKIDKSFVRHMAINPADERIVRSINDLDHDLGMVVVAEGVEDEETLQLLRRMGCDVAQGYHLSRPLPGPELLEWVRTWNDRSQLEQVG